MSLIDKDRFNKLYDSDPPQYSDAIAIQKELKDKVVSKNGFNQIKTVAGADLAILKDEKKLVCGIIVFSYPELNEIERTWEVVDEEFPYIPGLLAFREGPAIIKTYEKLKEKPDVLILDGHGIAHPRGFGIACYVGVLLDIPTMGIAKKRLYGTHQEPRDVLGSYEPLFSKNGEQIGVALKTKKKTKPVFISAGHKIDLSTSKKIALMCVRGYRIPEPTRLADKYVAELKRGLANNA
ncbi:MAG: deoxyribonuclease V [Deltaproteobacteria bacterium]|nr:deoxyribonuclease V [Deltaproteobacteria bacterium]MCK5708962.1 deoxyribonuclease V [Deltaproteobacteria bacterium]